MTDSKTPEWAGPRYSVHIIPANNKVQMLERSDGDWVKFSDASQALLSAYERGRKEGIEEAASHLEGLAKATPLGHENVQRGRSTYNWLTHHARAIRQLLEVKG